MIISARKLSVTAWRTWASLIGDALLGGLGADLVGDGAGGVGAPLAVEGGGQLVGRRRRPVGARPARAAGVAD